jgi:hypothetical protein
MATEQKISSLLDRMPPAFPMDKDATMGAWKTWTEFNERFAGIALDTAARSNEIVTNTAQETISQLREVTRVYEEPGDYGQALANFTQAQVNLTRDTMEAMMKLMQQAKDDAAQLFTKTGEETAEAAEENVKTAARKTQSQAKKASSETKKAAEDVTDAAEA